VESNTLSRISTIGFDIGSGDFEILRKQIDKCFNLTGKNTVDILINNAGYLVNKPFIDLTETDWQKTFEVNVFGSVKLIQILYPHFNRKQAAHIVNIASMGGVQGVTKFPGLAAYSASKGAVNILT
jgi:NAD(P)-dependent dehydrogenase (short-subunit alcohol dehydrogenase family)